MLFSLKPGISTLSLPYSLSGVTWAPRLTQILNVNNVQCDEVLEERLLSKFVDGPEEAPGHPRKTYDLFCSLQKEDQKLTQKGMQLLRSSEGPSVKPLRTR